MNRFKIDKAQQKRLKSLYRLEKDCQVYHWGTVVVAVIMVMTSLGPMIIPFQEIAEEADKYPALLGGFINCLGVVLYSNRYKNYLYDQGENIAKSIYSIIRYAPVDRQQVLLYTLQKTMAFATIEIAVIIIIRCCISFGTYGSISLWDILFPLVAAIIFPTLAILLDHMLATRRL